MNDEYEIKFSIISMMKKEEWLENWKLYLVQFYAKHDEINTMYMRRIFDESLELFQFFGNKV